MSGTDFRIVLVGWGAIATRVATLLADRAASVEIVAIAVRDEGVPRKGLPKGAVLLSDPEKLSAFDADLMVEAADRAAVAPWAKAALAQGWDVALSSTSALTDASVRDDLIARARKAGAQILIPPGALGGIDALAAASRLGLAQVRHEIVKPAAAWAGTKAETLCDLGNLAGARIFFEGTAREAADAFPQNANVAVISALAGIGLDRTIVALTADPDAKLNSHRIEAKGDFGNLTVQLENRPLATNPKSSEMTALSLLRLIENRAATLVI